MKSSLLSGFILILSLANTAEMSSARDLMTHQRLFKTCIKQAQTRSTAIGIQNMRCRCKSQTNLLEKSGFVESSHEGSHSLIIDDVASLEMAGLHNSCMNRSASRYDHPESNLETHAINLDPLASTVDGLEKRSFSLKTLQFSTTSKLRGEANLVLGGSKFLGNAQRKIGQPDVARANAKNGATTLNFDLKLLLQTSFTGQDNLVAILRSGNFDGKNNPFGGGGPSPLSQLATAFQEGKSPAKLGIYKAYYSFPWGKHLRLTLGGTVGQKDMLGLLPGVYPSSSILEMQTLYGSPAAYNQNRGAGAGITWKHQGFSASANYVAGNGNISGPGEGGLGTGKAGSTGTLQIGYEADRWALAAIYSSIQNGHDIVDYGTTMVLESFKSKGTTSAFALSGYWQPLESGWMPSISAGWGFNSTQYDDSTPTSASLVSQSQSWSVGLNWSDVFTPGNHAGMAVGEPVFATALHNNKLPDDGNYVWEWWYQVRLTDNISITPALFYLSRPFGQDTHSGSTFRQVGGLVKTTFSF